MRGKLYMSRVETPSGNVGHEVVALVSAEALQTERARREAAIVGVARAARWERERAESAEFNRKSEALFLAAEQWIADRRERLGDTFMNGGKAGW